MTANTAMSGTAVTSAYDFSGIERLVDVGGGHGLLLATVLRAYPTMRGVLFDLPTVAAGAAAVLEEAGVADRCDIVGGNFYPADTRNHRLNVQVIDVNHSPVGSTFGYYTGGQNGTTYSVAFSVFF